jgi:hypothetical protein
MIEMTIMTLFPTRSCDVHPDTSTFLDATLGNAWSPLSYQTRGKKMLSGKEVTWRHLIHVVVGSATPLGMGGIFLGSVP